MRENADENNSEYGYFSRSDDDADFIYQCNVIVSLLSVSGLFQGTPSSGLFLL